MEMCFDKPYAHIYIGKCCAIAAEVRHVGATESGDKEKGDDVKEVGLGHSLDRFVQLLRKDSDDVRQAY